MAQESSLYQNVTRQFDKAADLMGLDPEIRKILSQTTNELVVNFPVKMDEAGSRCSRDTVSNITMRWVPTREGLGFTLPSISTRSGRWRLG
jgi:hypothetical protein